MSLRSEEEWWWALDPDQDRLREVLEREGFPPVIFQSRRPVFDQEVDMTRVKDIALRLRYGTYDPVKEEALKKSSPRKKRSRK